MSRIIALTAAVIGSGWILVLTPILDARDALHVAEAGQAKAVIVTPAGPTPGESFAASELQSYLGKISGARFELKAEGSSGDLEDSNELLLLLGEAGRGEILGRLLKAGKIDPPPPAEFGDSFMVKVIADEKPSYLCIVGTGQLGLEYGVYDVLERAFRIGFFPEDETVPRQSTLTLPRFDYREAPSFPRRTHQASALDYTDRYFDIDDWHQEIRWTVKNKFNTIMIYKGHQAVFKEIVLPRYGTHVEPTPYEKHQAKLAREAGAYARSLGLMVVTPVLPDSFPVPAEFFKANPEVQHFEVSWVDQDPLMYVDPRDPAYVEMTKVYLNAYIERFGTSHVYYVDPYPEIDPGGSAKEREAILVGYAKNTARAIREIHPDATWFMSGWSFLDRRNWKDRGLIRRFLENIPTEMLVVNDTYGDDNPIHGETNYFWGKNWGFGVVHTFGSNHTLHGDVADLVHRVRAVLDDPKANRCVNLYMAPESYRSNNYYWSLLTRLAWSGKEVALNDYTADYVERRYGKEAAPVMLRAFDHLKGEDGVYTIKQLSAPYPFQKHVKSLFGLRRYSDARLIPSTLAALRLAQQAARLEPENPLLRKDLIDIARRLLGDSISQAMVEVYMAAFHEVNAEKFHASSGKILDLLDVFERLLATHESYTLQKELRQGEKILGKGPCFKPFYMNELLPVDRELRLRYTALTNLDKPLHEYNRKDLYELYRFYYRPRLKAWLDAVRQARDREDRQLSKEQREELEKTFNAITRVFVVSGYELDRPLPSGNPIDVVEELLQLFGPSGE